MNRKSTVDAEPLNGFQILIAAHDYVWRQRSEICWRDRFDATDLLWSMAIKVACSQRGL